LLVIVIVIALSELLFDPATADLTAASGAYSALMISNIFFFQHSGYFAPEAETMPLLHMWSLGVEEQFYLIWPAAILALAVLRPRLRLVLVAGTVIGLLVATEFAVDRYPDAAFFLTPFRIVEFCCGAALSFRRPAAIRGQARVVAAALITMFACFFLYSPEIRFPGLVALVPCLATAAVIAWGKGSLAGHWLGSRIAVAIGDRSYALYLVHWPVLVFLAVLLPLMQTGYRALLAVALTAVITELIYRFWEQPLRYWNLPSGRMQVAFAGGVFAAASLIVGGSAAIAGNALRSQQVKWARPVLAGCKEPKTAEFANCVSDYIVFGDSHAGHTQTLLATATSRQVAKWSFAGCPPLFGAYLNYGARKDRWRTAVCQQLVDQWKNYIPKAHAQVVVLAARWDWLSQDTRFGAQPVTYNAVVRGDSDPGNPEHSQRVIVEQLAHTIATLRAAGKRVILMGQVPPHISAEIACAKTNLHRSDVNTLCRRVSRSEILSRVAFMNKVILASAANQHDVTAIIPSDIMCDPECDIVRSGRLLYKDDNHLNRDGSKYLARALKKSGFDFP
jgi:peptidoglycan/LPS O-acetylase OafA/YrhL